jgi:cell division protein ZapE
VTPPDFHPPAAPSADPGEGAAPSALEPIAAYRSLCRQGLIEPDPAQQRAVARLQSLFRALAQYRPQSGFLGWLARFGLAELPGAEAPQGLYLCGPVGRGKTMLMDLFFRAVDGVTKRRVHFHAFMLEVHARIERERRAGTKEPIGKVAADIAHETALLCFDEFEVGDIADAMILERLFRALFEAGVVVVATSNRPPGELYPKGFHRERLLLFIALLEEKLDILELDGGRDWRLARMAGRSVYHYPLGAAAHGALAASFAELTDGAAGRSAALAILGRSLPVPRAARGVAWFQFAELCVAPLAAADYLAIAEHFSAVIVEGVPQLGPAERDPARRFNILVDTLYEARTLLIVSAAVPPEEIYVAGDGAFEFRRTVSRLHEMQSAAYIAGATPAG